MAAAAAAAASAATTATATRATATRNHEYCRFAFAFAAYLALFLIAARRLGRRLELSSVPMPRDQIGETRAALKFTKICQYWQKKGRCHLGDLCTYAHSWSELREQPNLAATALCTKFKRKGYCAKGAACRFAHGQSELRKLPDTSEISHDDLKKEEMNPSPVLWRSATMAQPMALDQIASSPLIAIQLDTARDSHAQALPQNSPVTGSGAAPSPVLGLDTGLIEQNEFLIGQVACPMANFPLFGKLFGFLKCPTRTL